MVTVGPYQPGYAQYKWVQLQVELTPEEQRKPFNAIRNLAVERAVEEMERRGWVPMTRPALVDRSRLIVGARWREADDGSGDALGDDAVPTSGGTSGGG